MQQNIFIHYAQKSTQLAVLTCLDSSSFIKFLYLGGLEEQLDFPAHRCMEQTYVQHHSNFWVFSDMW